MLGSLLIFLFESTFGVAYPVYQTIQSLKVPEKSSKDFTSWTFYWVVFSVLQTLSWYLDWMNFFVGLKMCLIAFMVAPKFDGSYSLYQFWNSFLFKRMLSCIDICENFIKSKFKVE